MCKIFLNLSIYLSSSRASKSWNSSIDIIIVNLQNKCNMFNKLYVYTSPSENQIPNMVNDIKTVDKDNKKVKDKKTLQHSDMAP